MKIQSFILTVSIIFCICGCEKEESQSKKKISLTSISFTNCNTVSRLTDYNYPSVRLMGLPDNRLLVKMNNTEFCCRTDSVSISKNIEDDRICIEINDHEPFTDCFCPHDVEFVLSPFETDDYEIKLIESEHAFLRDTFLIHFSYSQQLDMTVTRFIPDNLFINVDSISADKYYSSEIFNDQNLKIYGQWQLKKIFGGFAGKDFEPIFDYLKIRPIGIYGKIRNDSLLEYGKIGIDKQIVDTLFIRLIPDKNSATFYSTFKQQVIFYKNDSMSLNEHVIDGIIYYFKKTK
jgi:hypothetical protein